MKTRNIKAAVGIGLSMLLAPTVWAGTATLNSGGTGVITLDNNDNRMVVTSIGEGVIWYTSDMGLFEGMLGDEESPVKNLTINLRNGDDQLWIDMLDLEGNLKIIGANGDDDIYFDYDVPEDYNMPLDYETGISQFAIPDYYGSEIGGKLTIVSGGGEDDLYLNWTHVEGRSSINTGGGHDRATFYSTYAGDQWRLILGSGDDLATVCYGRSQISTFMGRTNVTAGGGDDTIIMDYARVYGHMGIATAAGADVVALNRNYFGDHLTVNTGAKNDLLGVFSNGVDRRTTFKGSSGMEDTYYTDGDNEFKDGTDTPDRIIGFEEGPFEQSFYQTLLFLSTDEVLDDEGETLLPNCLLNQ